MSNFPRFLILACAAASLGAAVQADAAAPVLTSLPPGASWQLNGTSSYDTGSKATETGGTNGQASGPFTDTSFGVMDEMNPAWFTGNDASDQQYVQAQAFGNFGTNSPPAPAGFRFNNNGTPGVTTVNGTSAATAANSNFPFNAREQRKVALDHWNNPNQDTAGTATIGQLVFVPTSATLTLGSGWGADELLLAVNGGNSGQTSEFRVDINLYSMFDTSAFGGHSFGHTTLDRNLINMNAIIEVNDAGAGNYGFDGNGEPLGYGAGGLGSGSNTISSSRDSNDAVFEEGVFFSDPGVGLTGNSVGHSMSRPIDVLSSLVQTGGSFDVDFASDAEIFITRQFGNADARASTGPGMQGTAQLVVEYEIWQAIPEPSSTGLVALALAALAVRRRT